MIRCNMWLVYRAEEVRFDFGKVTSPFWAKHIQVVSYFKVFVKMNAMVDGYGTIDFFRVDIYHATNIGKGERKTRSSF